MKKMLSGWGRFPRMECRVERPRTESALARMLAEGSLIARGNGRSYGDCAMNAHATADMRHFNHMLEFNTTTGQLTVEAGVILADIISTFLPLGWFPPVTPGTKFVTIGGMIAADVHGKNHHKHGSFGGFVDWIDVMQADGSVVRCSPQENRDTFEWTLGSMGLTGIILRACFRLKRVETGWIRQRVLPTANLDATLAVFEESMAATYSVAWVDCMAGCTALGRSLVMLGEHASLSELSMDAKRDPFPRLKSLKMNVMMDVPSFVLHPAVIKTLNSIYSWKGTLTADTSLVEWDRFFYPLDSIQNWNRIYGKNGLVQFQCVLPLRTSRDGLRLLLETIGASGQVAPLGVLKRMGRQESRFSFPMEGYTLALDFPLTDRTATLLEALDRISIDHGGRFYLAKDARMTADTLRASDARLSDFVLMREAVGRSRAFKSGLSDRLGI